MFNFSGCKCPVCQQPFHEGDDIVVCPDCGAPYHRDCYQQHGGCVFTDRHGENFEWKPAPAEAVCSDDTDAQACGEAAGELRCARCGAMNPEQALFCETCGAPLRSGAPTYSSDVEPKGAATYGPASVPVQDPFHVPGLPFEAQVHPDEEFEGIKATDWAAYLGDNAAWYMLNFKQMKATGRKIAISFSAFLFGPCYFLYRKMWVPAFTLLAASVLLHIPGFLEALIISEFPINLGISPQVLSVLTAVSSTILLLLQLLCGSFAVNLYKKISARRIRKILANGPVDAAVLKKAGGTSKIALVIFLGVVFLLSFLFVAFLTGPMIWGATVI